MYVQSESSIGAYLYGIVLRTATKQSFSRSPHCLPMCCLSSNNDERISAPIEYRSSWKAPSCRCPPTRTMCFVSVYIVSRRVVMYASLTSTSTLQALPFSPLGPHPLPLFSRCVSSLSLHSEHLLSAPCPLKQELVSPTTTRPLEEVLGSTTPGLVASP